MTGLSRWAMLPKPSPATSAFSSGGWMIPRARRCSTSQWRESFSVSLRHTLIQSAAEFELAWEE